MLRAVATLVLGISLPAAALAEPVSPWVRDGGAALRLIAGEQPVAGPLRAGIEIRLDSGWKTYWRSPGQSGVPARFDWSASRNLAAVEVLWPLPSRFQDQEGTTVGYKGTVVLPLRVTPRDPAEPVRLAGTVSYAICETLCVPAMADVALDLDRAGGVDPLAAAQLTGFEARVPERGVLAATGEFGIAGVTRDDKGNRVRLTVDVQAPREGGGVDLFAAPVEDDLWVGVPVVRERDESGRSRWSVVLSGQVAGRSVDLVAVAGRRAISVPIALDGLAATP